MLSIGPHTFKSPFILAPLAGYSDLPFRLLCRRYGAAFCVSEMISCHGLSYRQSNTMRMLNSVAEEKPVSFQLFGAEPEIMEEAARILESLGPEMIDINMGCPVKKVTKRGAGAGLMTTPLVAADIINRITKAVSIPVTVKIRAGKDQQHINCVDYAKMAEDCGASAVTVHARTWAQGFGGVIDPQHILNVKNNVSIPVIGNGDILAMKDGHAMMEATGCDGVMVGRGALGNPWIFTAEGRPSGVAEIAKGALQHLELIEEHLPAEKMMGYVKNQMSRYFKSLPGASGIRKSIFDAPSIQEIKVLLAQKFS
jgi:tRNA-dihydrouridine synthase B